MTGEEEMFEQPPVPGACPTVQIPLLRTVPTGFPEDGPPDFILEWVSLPDAPPGSCALIVKGDSMSPAIRDGDYVVFVVCRSEYLKNGDVVVALNERNEALVRRYCTKEDAVYLVSDNRNYSTFKVV